MCGKENFTLHLTEFLSSKISQYFFSIFDLFIFLKIQETKWD